MKELMIRSTLDGSDQPSLFHYAGEGCPLLVALHTWSFDRHNPTDMLPYAEESRWSVLMPEFRGPNLVSNPNCRQACASPLAIQDILDAIDYVCRHYKVDEENILLLGLSGGGHMALMTAAKAPTLFNAVAAFVPITDLVAWHTYSDHYRPHIEACLGGSPSEVGEEAYMARSPISYVDELAQANLKIFHGKYDHVVPFDHSMRLYNLLCERHPTSRVFLDIFDGGHEMNVQSALTWFASQMGERQLTSVTG